MGAVACAPAPGTWNPLARAMGISAAGAVASGLLSLAATKILAVMLGPAPLALLGTLQQVRDTALVAGTANGSTALVQGASALEGRARCEFLRTGTWIFAAAAALACAALLLAPQSIARWAGLPSADASMLPWLAPAVALAATFVFSTALLNARGAVSTLAVLQTAGPGAMALAAWPVARAVRGGASWLFPAMLALAACTAVAGAIFALRPHRTALREWFRGAGSWFSSAACRHFFSISAAMLVTGLAGSAALLTVRGNILRGQGLAVAGQFDAAWGLSMSQVTLVLASLQTFYLPALAKLRRPEDRAAQIGLVLALAAPSAALVIAGIALFKPLALRLLYSAAFEPASQYLRWTLLGDYLKVTSWILSIPMLASAHMRVFLASDLAAAAAFVIPAAVLARWWSPAESAAMAFVAMHAVHLVICLWYAGRHHAFRLRGRTLGLWTAGLALAGAASALTWNA